MATLKTRLSLLEMATQKATGGNEVKHAIESCFAALCHVEAVGLDHVRGLAARIREGQITQEDHATLWHLPTDALAILGMEAPAFVAWIIEIEDRF